jgi:hypothetical protein
MMDEWQTIIDFDVVAVADATWRTWLQNNDISGLGDTDIRVDTGCGDHDGKRRAVRRYLIRTSALPQVKRRSLG